MKLLLSLLIVTAIATLSAGQQTCGPFSMTVSTDDDATLTCSQIGATTTWDFTIDTTTDNGDGVITCTVLVTTNPRSVGTATFKSDLGSGVELRVTLQGSNTGNHPVNVASIVTTGSTGPIRLETLVVSSNVGSIAVNDVDSVSIGQNFTGSIVASTGGIGSITIEGTTSGGVMIKAENGTIGTISVQGSGADLGTSGSPATVLCDQLNNLFVDDDMRADLTVGDSPSYGPVGRIEVGGTYAAGTLHFDQIDDISTGASGLYLASNLFAHVTIEDDLDEPIDITNNLIGSITIKGDITSTGSVAVGEDVSGTLLVEGEVAASSEIAIAEDLTGTLSVDGDVDGDISIGGTVAHAISENAIDIGGALAGTLDIGENLRGAVEIAGGASGDITVAGSLGLAAGPTYGSLTLGTQGNSTPITAEISFGDTLFEGFVQINQPYAGVFTVDGNVNLELTGAGDSGVEFYGGLSGTFQLVDLAEDPDAHVDGTIIVGNGPGNSGGAFTSTGVISILDDVRDGAAILFKDECLGLVQIGLGLNSGGLIHAQKATDPLQGQIIINALSPAMNPGTWSGDVKYGTGPTTISGPSYAATSAAWGGGAVGVVPFQLHDEDCFPANGESIAPNDGLIALRFYGPVDWDSGFPFNITWCPSPFPSCDPAYENERWVVLSGKGTRTIYLQYVDELLEPASIPEDRYYQLFPVLTGSNKLLCDDLLTEDDVLVTDFVYEFDTVGP